MAVKGTWRGVRPPLILSLLLVALAGAVATGAAADRGADITTEVNVNGDHEACKDLLVAVEVYDDRGYVIASCCWDGRHDALGETKASGNHLGRTVDEFTVKVTVRYEDQPLLDKETVIRVHGRGTLIEFDGRTVELEAGNDDDNSTWELEEPLRVVRTIDGRTVEVILRPRAEVSSSGDRRVFLYRVNGEVTVHDKEGDYRASFEAEAYVGHTSPNPTAVTVHDRPGDYKTAPYVYVVHASLNPIVAIVGSAAGLLRLFRGRRASRARRPN